MILDDLSGGLPEPTGPGCGDREITQVRA